MLVPVCYVLVFFYSGNVIAILLSIPHYHHRVNSLVGADTSSFQSLGAQLFVLVGDQVDAERELVDVRALSAKIEDSSQS